MDSLLVSGVLEHMASNNIEMALSQLKQIRKNENGEQAHVVRLYFLCLMQLTFLEKREDLCRKQAIKKLLHHLCNHLSVELEESKGQDLFSSYAFFQMICAWDKLGIDLAPVFKLQLSWNWAWISERGPYTLQQLHILTIASEVNTDDFVKYQMQSRIALEYIKEGNFKEAISLARATPAKYYQLKDLVFAAVSNEKCEQHIWNQAISAALEITHNEAKNKTLAKIVERKVKEEPFALAIQPLHLISENRSKLRSLMHVHAALKKQNKLDEAIEVLKMSLEITKDIPETDFKIEALILLSEKWRQLGFVKDSQVAWSKAMEYTHASSDVWLKFQRLKNTAYILMENDNVDLASLITKEAEKCIPAMPSISNQCSALIDLATEFSSCLSEEPALQMIHLAVKSAQAIEDHNLKGELLISMAIKMSQAGHTLTLKIMEDALETIKNDFLFLEKSVSLKKIIARNFILAQRFEDALFCAEIIDDEWVRDKVLAELCTALLRAGNVKDSISYVKYAHHDYNRSFILRSLYPKLKEMKEDEVAEDAIQASIDHAFKIQDSYWLGIAVRDITEAYANQGMWHNSAALLERYITHGQH